MYGYTDIMLHKTYTYRSRNRNRATYRIRTTVLITVALILIVACINIGLGLNKATGSSSKDFKKVVVGSGDTLWSIAQEEKGKDVDIRKAIHAISEENNISANDLKEGDTLLIPMDITE